MRTLNQAPEGGGRHRPHCTRAELKSRQSDSLPICRALDNGLPAGFAPLRLFSAELAWLHDDVRSPNAANTAKAQESERGHGTREPYHACLLGPAISYNPIKFITRPWERWDRRSRRMAGAGPWGPRRGRIIHLWLSSRTAIAARPVSAAATAVVTMSLPGRTRSPVLKHRSRCEADLAELKF
jgi:hypothetical protein